MALTLEDSARLAGSHCWVESKLFEVLGGWVKSTPEAEARLMLDRHSQHHAWRAGQWRDRLPMLADVEREALVQPPDEGVEAALDALAALEPTVSRLAGAYRVVLPRLATSYRRHRELADPLSDGSSIWLLDLIQPALAADWQEGEAVVQGLLVDAGAVEQAASVVERLESAVVTRRG